MRSRALSGPVRVLALSLGAALAVLAFSGCDIGTAARVNGVAIPKAQVDAELAKLKSEHKDIFAGENGKKLEAQFRKRILDNLVTNILVVQEAKAQGVAVTDEEVQKKIDEMAGRYGTKEKFEAEMAKSGTTIDVLKERIRTQLLTQRMVNKVTDKVKVSDAEARAYYKANRELYGGEQQLRVLMIRFPLGAGKHAKTVADQIKAGRSFTAAAKQESADPAAKATGGDLGVKPLSGLPRDIAAQARAAPVGKVVGPFPATNGYYIIKVLKKSPPKQRPYAEVKAQVMDVLKQEKQIRAYNDWIESLKKKANVSTS